MTQKEQDLRAAYKAYVEAAKKITGAKIDTYEEFSAKRGSV